MAESSFKAAFGAIPRAKFKSAAGKERGGFTKCTAPEGRYHCKLTNVRRGKSDDGPYVSFNFVILDGQYKGQNPGEYMGLAAKGKRTVEQAIAGLHWYLQDLGFTTDETWGPEEFEQAFAALDKDQPECMVDLTKNGNFLNVRVVELLDHSNSGNGDEEIASTEEETPGTDLYTELETLYTNQDYDQLQVVAANAGSQLDANDYGTWEDYWLALAEEVAAMS